MFRHKPTTRRPLHANADRLESLCRGGLLIEKDVADGVPKKECCCSCALRRNTALKTAFSSVFRPSRGHSKSRSLSVLITMVGAAIPHVPSVVDPQTGQKPTQKSSQGRSAFKTVRWSAPGPSASALPAFGRRRDIRRAQPVTTQQNLHMHENSRCSIFQHQAFPLGVLVPGHTSLNMRHG